MSGSKPGSALTRGWHGLLRAGLKVLRADPDPPNHGDGRWPSSWQGFLWDLAPDEVAPSRDGVIPPKDHLQPWLVSIGGRATASQLETIIQLERERNEAARHAAETAEAKASRLLTPVVALLTGAVAVVALQFNMASQAASAAGMIFLFASSIPAVAATGFLFVAATRALDADTRVGVYRRFVAHEVADTTPERQAQEEHLAANRAAWNSTQKATRLMHARAAVSRSILCLVLALLLLAATTLAKSFATLPSTGPAHPSPSPQPTTTVPPPSVAPSSITGTPSHPTGSSPAGP
jgi:hypothetical protein